MKIYCTKQEFRKLIVDCEESKACPNCALYNICDSQLVKGEFIANISIISDADKVIEQSDENS